MVQFVVRAAAAEDTIAVSAAKFIGCGDTASAVSPSQCD
jgi:hypothetical protein